MRGSVIRAARRRGHTVVGQVRRDTALFELPPPRAPGRRGRSRLYGAKLDAEAVAQLPVSHHRIGGYDDRMVLASPKSDSLAIAGKLSELAEFEQKIGRECVTGANAPGSNAAEQTGRAVADVFVAAC